MKQTAQGLAALGRGPDTQLVHMAPSEVAGLQALAMKHGGSLTINPDTGLPEAGFLSSILPMVAGFALGPAGFGLMSSAMAGITVGGISALTSGSLSKGLMAGLGAYGGSGLGEGLMGAATTAPAVGPALPTAVPEAALAAPTAAPTITATGAAPVTPGMQQLAGVPGKEVTSMLPQSAIAAPPVSAPVATVTPMAPSTSSGFGGVGTDLSVAGTPPPQTAMEKLASGARNVTDTPGAAWEFAKANKFPLGAMGISALGSMQPDELNAPEASKGMIRPYTYSREKIPGAFEDVAGAPRSSKERRYFTDQFTAGTPYAAPGPEYMAMGGPVEAMSNANAIGASTGFPQSDIRTGAYSNPFQQPMGQNVVTGAQDAAVDPYTGQAQFAMGGGVSDLGGYSDGGRLLRGGGDGVSDSIPAQIGDKQPARLADGEFVVPARIVSELGNGSTEAGARQLYAMMDRVQKNRKKSIGKGKVAADSKSSKLLPA